MSRNSITNKTYISWSSYHKRRLYVLMLKFLSSITPFVKTLEAVTLLNIR